MSNYEIVFTTMLAYLNIRKAEIETNQFQNNEKREFCRMNSIFEYRDMRRLSRFKIFKSSTATDKKNVRYHEKDLA